MKKISLIFSLVCAMIISLSSNAQEINLEEFKTKETYRVSKSELLKSYPQLNRKEEYKNAELLVLKNGMELIKWDNIKEGYTYDYAVFNKSKKDLTYFHIKIEDNKLIEVFNSDNLSLYTVSNINGKEVFTISNQVEGKNCFRDCMEESEEAVVDGFMGWAAWNLSPGVQIAAALLCAYEC